MCITCVLTSLVRAVWFHRKEETGMCGGQLCQAIWYTVAFFFVFALTLVLMYVFLRTAESKCTCSRQCVAVRTKSLTNICLCVAICAVMNAVPVERIAQSPTLIAGINATVQNAVESCNATVSD